MLVVAGDRVPGSSQIHLTGATTLWDHGPEPDWVPEASTRSLVTLFPIYLMALI